MDKKDSDKWYKTFNAAMAGYRSTLESICSDKTKFKCVSKSIDDSRNAYRRDWFNLGTRTYGNAENLLQSTHPEENILESILYKFDDPTKAKSRTVNPAKGDIVSVCIRYHMYDRAHGKIVDTRPDGRFKLVLINRQVPKPKQGEEPKAPELWLKSTEFDLVR